MMSFSWLLCSCAPMLVAALSKQSVSQQLCVGGKRGFHPDDTVHLCCDGRCAVCAERGCSTLSLSAFGGNRSEALHGCCLDKKTVVSQRAKLGLPAECRDAQETRCIIAPARPPPPPLSLPRRVKRAPFPVPKHARDLATQHQQDSGLRYNCTPGLQCLHPAAAHAELRGAKAILGCVGTLPKLLSASGGVDARRTPRFCGKRPDPSHANSRSSSLAVAVADGCALTAVIVSGLPQSAPGLSNRTFASADVFLHTEGSDNYVELVNSLVARFQPVAWRALVWDFEPLVTTS